MILINDFKAEPPSCARRCRPRLTGCSRPAGTCSAKELQAFERSWAEACGTPHCLGVGNGMDAIELCAAGARHRPGRRGRHDADDRLRDGARDPARRAEPVLADIEPDSGLLSPASVRRCLSGRTRAVLLVHLYGQMRDMPAWIALCHETGVQLIEDCAQSHLARWDDRVAGSIGAAGAYSFYPTKNLGAIGDGGALVTRSEAIAQRVGRLRNYGQSRTLRAPGARHEQPARRAASCIAERASALARGFTKRRRAIATRYDAAIDNPQIELLAPPQQADAHVHHLYVVRCASRAALARYLGEREVQTLIHYPVPIHRQAPCTALRRDPQGLPQSEQHAATCLTIPMPSSDDGCRRQTTSSRHSTRFR
jgi:dTDP-4-amino-4,6-dideoxygalactose transaminase